MSAASTPSPMRRLAARVDALGRLMSRLGERWMPDPFVIILALLLLVTLVGGALGPALDELPLRQRPGALAEAFLRELYALSLMKFAMQMALVLLLGHALALAPAAQRAIGALTARVRTFEGAIVMVASVSAVASLIQWGMGVILGALMAREAGRALAARGQPAHYPLLGAAGYAGFMVWHGGLSGSAPLAVAGQGHALADLLGVIPIERTLGSPLNLVITAALLVVIPGTLWAIRPRRPEDMTPCEWTPRLATPPSDASSDAAPGLERALGVSVGALILAACAWRLATRGAQGWDLDTINACVLGLGLLAHPSPSALTRAVLDGARGCAPILLQFPLYFGLLGLLKATGLVSALAHLMASLASPGTLPAWTFLSAGLINLLVPSGGGQWAVQGPIIAQSALAMGLDPAPSVMAFCYGDAWTNMLQPLWALPLLGVMGLRASQIIGYTTLVWLVTGPVILAGLLLL